jgi:hypothetical protein
MTALRRKVVEATMDQVEVVYLSRETSKWWNARRRPEDTATFCGYYWIRNREEMGPFRSRSACVRDAYYKFVLQRELPSVGRSQLLGVEQTKVVKIRRKVA